MEDLDLGENSSFSENCTLWGLPCAKADLEDPILNPSLWPPSNLVHWGEGLVLPALAVAALVANLVLLRLLVCRLARPGDWLMTLLAISSTLLLVTVTLLRTPQSLSLPILPPQAVVGLTVLERALTNFITLLFVIFVGDRHLRQLEQVSYVWLKPVLFCLIISILAAVPFLWEVALVNMSREELDQAVDLTNSTLDTGNGDDEVEVFRRTPLWHNLVYKNMVRHLLPVLTSQVATIWLLPMLLFHSRDVAKILDKQRKRGRGVRRGDRLLPTLCFVFILLTLPNLADLVIQILLHRSPVMLHVIQSLSTCLLLLLIPLLTLIIDPEMRYRLAACSVLRHRVQVPTEDY